MAKKLLPLVKLASTFGLAALGAGPLSLLPLEAVSHFLQRLIGKDVLDELGELSGNVIGELAGEYASEFLKSFSRAPDQDLRRLYLMALQIALDDERDHLQRSYGERVFLGKGRRELPTEEEQLFDLWFEKIDNALEDEDERDMLFFKGGPIVDQIVGAKTDDEYQELWWNFLEKTLVRWNSEKPLPPELSSHLRADLPELVADALNDLLASGKYQHALNKYQADFQNLIYGSLSELHRKTDIVNEKQTVALELLIEQRDRIEQLLNRLDSQASRADDEPTFPIHRIGRNRVRHFVGRDEMLKEIHRILSEGEAAALTAIHGLGGVGKTQLAAEYAYEHKDRYRILWWITSENSATITADFTALAASLRLPEKDAPDISEMVEAVKRELNEQADWLLIFDNAPNAAEVRGYLPSNRKGHILVTSRDPNWRGLARPLEVPELKPDDAVRFLLERADQKDEEAARQLADELGCLPLALEQAAAYMEGAKVTVSEYLELFVTQRRELWADDEPPGEYPKTVAETWLISMEAAEDECPDSAALMRLCAHFAPDDIPLRMLEEGAEHLPDALAACIANKVAFNKAIKSLRRYSLIERGGDSLSVHRLVQTVTRDRLSEDERKQWAEAAVSVVNEAFPTESGDVRTWPECEMLLPHALAAARHGEELNVAAEATGRLLNQMGLYFYGRAQYTEAKDLYERVKRIWGLHLGEDHPNVATVVNNLGEVLRMQGNLPEARKCYERAKRIDEAAFGPDHPNVARGVNNLGSVLQDEGNLSEARKCYERAMRIDEAAFGPDHPKVAIRVNNLGSVLKAEGNLSEARKCYERAMRIDEAAYGPDHPNVAIRVNNLGGVLQAEGNLPEARKCFDRAIRIDEAAFGPDHPQVAIRVNNLGSVLQAEGNLTEARKCYERAMRIGEAAFGPDHPQVAWHVWWLGSLDQAEGDFDSARKHYERALRIFTAFLGEEHPRTVNLRNHLKSLG